MHSAPVCQGSLFELLGYSTDTEIATTIMEGTFVPSPSMATSTIIILEEIARILEKMSTGGVNMVISQEDHEYYWKRAKERTALSFSGLNFGHYKAAAYLDLMSKTHALKISLIT